MSLEVLKIELQTALSRLRTQRALVVESEATLEAAVKAGADIVAGHVRTRLARQRGFVKSTEDLVRELEKAVGAFDFGVEPAKPAKR